MKPSLALFIVLDFFRCKTTHASLWKGFCRHLFSPGRTEWETSAFTQCFDVHLQFHHAMCDSFLLLPTFIWHAIASNSALNVYAKHLRKMASLSCAGFGALGGGISLVFELLVVIDSCRETKGNLFPLCSAGDKIPERRRVHDNSGVLRESEFSHIQLGLQLLPVRLQGHLPRAHQPRGVPRHQNQVLQGILLLHGRGWEWSRGSASAVLPGAWVTRWLHGNSRGSWPAQCHIQGIHDCLRRPAQSAVVRVPRCILDCLVFLDVLATAGADWIQNRLCPFSRA